MRDCARDQAAAEKADLLRKKIEAEIARKAVASATAAPPQPDPNFIPLEEIKARMNAQLDGVLRPVPGYTMTGRRLPATKWKGVGEESDDDDLDKEI